MLTFTRRTFLKSASTLAASALLSGRSGLSFARDRGVRPDLDFPTDPRSRVAIASWPFRAYIESPGNDDRDPKVPGMSLRDFPAYIAKTFNVHNVEPYNRHFASTDKAYLAGLHKALEKAQVHAVNIAVDGENSFYDADPAIRQKAVSFAKSWIDAATRIGCPSIRTNDPQAKNSKPDLQRVVDGLREVADYAASKNVVVNLENDNLVSEDAFFQVRVIEAVNHPYLRALPDFGNSMGTGDPDFAYRAVQAMFQHAYNICHVKEGGVDVNGKAFHVDLAKVFGMLKSSGYRGYCSIEYDGQGDPHAPTTHLVQKTVEYLG
jgi:sugar phosphate isomerase/epimerase